MTTGTVTLHRVLKAPPMRVYRAFIEPDALAKWLPPHGFTCKVAALDARVGGQFRMSFTHFASGHTHAFGGEYLALEPGKRIRYTDRFDDLRYSTGLAFSWSSPIGPLKFSFGHPLNKKDNDEIQRFQFQLGSVF